MVKVCWNCIHCDTFGGVCFKDKFPKNHPRMFLENYGCDEFEDSVKPKMITDAEKLQQIKYCLVTANVALEYYRGTQKEDWYDIIKKELEKAINITFEEDTSDNR